VEKVLAAACLSAAGAFAPFAAAQDVLTLVLGASFVHDSNLFRLPDSADPQAVLGSPSKSDTLLLLSSGVRIDKPYWQQRFRLDIVESRFRHGNFSRLDFDALDYRGEWQWHLTPRLSGKINTERRQALVPFSEFQSTERNVRNTYTRASNLDWRAFGGWHLLLGVSSSEQVSEVPFLAEADFSMHGPEAGIKYEAASGSTISMTHRLSRGDYRNRAIDFERIIDNGFEEDETEAQLHWIRSGRSTIDGRLVWRERRHEHFPQRDFAGWVGELGYTWRTTGKLRFNLNGRRNIAPSSELFSSYRITDALAFMPIWQASPKTAVRLLLEHSRSEFRAPVVPPVDAPRVDTQRNAQIGADWTPTRYGSLSVSLQRQRRSSNAGEFGFESTILSITAALSL
jgi:exopolysaccharide biosynthesis operon protein EpsL